MKVSVETKGELERRISVTVPASEVSTKYKEELTRAAKDVHLKGFRPGRVPKSELERRFGKRLRREVAFDVARRSWPKAAEQESLQPATTPTFEIGDWQDGRDLHYHASFECMPEFDLVDFSELDLVRPSAEVTEEDIDRVLNEMREQHKSWQPSEGRAAELDDHLTVDFELLDQESEEVINRQEAVEQPVSDYSKDPFAVPPKEGLLGVRAGEEHEFDWQVPEDYPGQEIAGRRLLVRYGIQAVLEPVLPAPDDAEFLQKMGVDDLDALHKAVRESLERNRDTRLEGLMREQALRRLSQVRDFSLPEGMVIDQMKRLREERQRYIQNVEQSILEQGGAPSDKLQAMGEDPEDREKASEYVKAALLLRKVINDHELRVADDELEQEIRRRCQYAEDPQAQFMEILENEDLVAGMEYELLQQTAMQYIVDHASTTPREESLEDLMKLSAEDLMSVTGGSSPQDVPGTEAENQKAENQED